eukprot:10966099-Ditylum_brightwellii.AAC.1
MAQVTVYVDNKAAVAMNNIETAYPGVAAHTASDIDILQAIWSYQMATNVKAQWVEAHQDTKYPDRELTHDAILNCKTDTDASKYMATTQRPCVPPPTFPTTAATLTVDGVVVTNKLKEIFRSAALCTDLQAYIRKKTGWTPNMMNLVQWTSMRL